MYLASISRVDEMSQMQDVYNNDYYRGNTFTNSLTHTNTADLDSQDSDAETRTSTHTRACSVARRTLMRALTHT